MKTKKAEQLNTDHQEKWKRLNAKWLWDLRSACWDNATSLLNDSELLLNNKRYSRSFFLSFTALEELGKYLFVCDYITGIVSEEEFKKSFSDHTLKIAYAHSNAQLTKADDGFYKATIIYDKSKFIEWTKYRNNSLYVDFENETKFIIPESEIAEELAKGMYNRAYSEMRNIRELEYLTERIGSKAFYK